MFRDKLTELIPPGSIGIIKHLVAKFLEFFNADYSDRLGDRFASFIVDSFSVLEFFKWHTTLLFRPVSQGLMRLYSSRGDRAKRNDPFGRGACRVVNLFRKKRSAVLLTENRHSLGASLA